jgi:lysozyme
MAQASALLRHDATGFEQVVANNVLVPLNQNQFDALVSFAYNIGSAGFLRSSAVSRLNAGYYNEVATRMLRWNTAGGIPRRGLTNRRIREGILFNTP